jgi:hypothetical protein
MQPQGHPQTTDRQPFGRARITRKPLSKWNGNTATGKRVRDLFRSLMAAAGNPADPVMQAHVLGLAELTVAVEVQRAKAVAGQDVDLVSMTRMQNIVHRELRRLGIKTAATSAAPATPSLAELLRQP